MRVAGMDLLDSSLLRILDLLRLPEMSAENCWVFQHTSNINFSSWGKSITNTTSHTPPLRICNNRWNKRLYTKCIKFYNNKQRDILLKHYNLLPTTHLTTFKYKSQFSLNLFLLLVWIWWWNTHCPPNRTINMDRFSLGIIQCKEWSWQVLTILSHFQFGIL